MTAAGLTFSEYCEDIIDQHIGLMNEDERSKAFTAYMKWIKPIAKTATAKHRDAALKTTQLKAKVARLIESQKIAAERNADKDISIVSAFVEQAENAMNRRATKVELIALIDLCSEASRHINSQA